MLLSCSSDNSNKQSESIDIVRISESNIKVFFEEIFNKTSDFGSIDTIKVLKIDSISDRDMSEFVKQSFKHILDNPERTTQDSISIFKKSHDAIDLEKIDDNNVKYYRASVKVEFSSKDKSVIKDTVQVLLNTDGSVLDEKEFKDIRNKHIVN